MWALYTVQSSKIRCGKLGDKHQIFSIVLGLFWKLDGHLLVIVVLWYRRMGHRLLKHVFVVLLIASCMLTCSYGAKHMPSRPLYIIMRSDKWPNTLASVQKLANVVRNWPSVTVILNFDNEMDCSTTQLLSNVRTHFTLVPVMFKPHLIEHMKYQYVVFVQNNFSWLLLVMGAFSLCHAPILVMP